VLPRPIGAIPTLICFTPAWLTAHEIPNDVTVQAFAKPAGIAAAAQQVDL
jgi:hypothetical protein